MRTREEDLLSYFSAVYRDYNWSVQRDYSRDGYVITCTMPSRRTALFVSLDLDSTAHHIAGAANRAVQSLLRSFSFNAEVRLVESILRQHFVGVNVTQNADGSMVIDLVDTAYGCTGQYHIESVETIVSFMMTIFSAMRRSQSYTVSPVTVEEPVVSSQEYRCVTSVMLERSVTL